VRYILQKLGMAILLLLAVSMLTFGAMNVLGDPLFNILGPIAGDTENPENLAKIEAAEAQYHLDDPLPVRYARWLGDFVTGDMGVQFSTDGQPPVSDLVAERLPRSLTLMIMAQTMALAIAIPWGVMSAARANKPVDRASTAVSFALVSLPNFALAVILLFTFGVKLDWLPDTYIATDPFLTRLHQLILPALTLALPAAAVYQRLLRTDLITTLQEDFILMARAKGVSRRRVLFRHALRPSMFSVITVFGINAGALIGGALVVESYFRIPGIGLSIVEAILREDFPVVLALVMIIAAGFVILNLLVDILYTVLDPRVRR
jgi:peptide/nickel transport system permease protein